MLVEQRRCQVCGTTVEDIHSQVGWIKLRGSDSNSLKVSIQGGRDETDNAARPIRNVTLNNDVDLCNIVCLLEYLYFHEEGFTGSTESIQMLLECIENQDKNKNRLMKVTELYSEVSATINAIQDFRKSKKKTGKKKTK